MAKSRVEKNKKLYATLDEEMKNSKENTYEEKLKNLDPHLQNNEEEVRLSKEKTVKKNENKSSNVLAVIAKEVNGKKSKKNELVVKKKNEVEEVIEEDDVFVDPISFTDKLSVEEILRAKIEKQEKIKSSKKVGKKAPTDSNYTAAMMQERIKQHVGVDVRKETRIKTKDYKWVALGLLIVAFIAVIVVGVLLVLKVIEF